MKKGKIIAVVYFIVLFFITLISRLTSFYPFKIITGVNWRLFNWLRESSYNDIVYSPAWMVDVIGNIILFMPYVPCIKKLLPFKNPPFLILQAFLLSCFIEVVQYTFSIGMASIDDVLMNTLGAWLGYKLYPFFKKFYDALEK